MIMLYEVRISTDFISSVAAIRPLRTSSTVTGSARFLAFFFSASGERRRSMSVASYRNHQVAVRIDAQRVAGGQHGGGGVLLYQRRAGDLIAGAQLVAPVGAALGPAFAGEEHPALAGHGFLR